MIDYTHTPTALVFFPDPTLEVRRERTYIELFLGQLEQDAALYVIIA